MKTLKEKKIEAKEEYKRTKQAYFNDTSNENWLKFCEARRTCMLLGVII